MIFYSGILEDLAKDTYQTLDSIIVYKGSQPARTSYIENFSNEYSWDHANSQILKTFKNVDLAPMNAEPYYRLYKPDSVSYQQYTKQSGSAEWAVLFDNTMVGDLISFSDNKINFLRSLTDDDLFMIVPATNNSADSAGVVRFNSIVLGSGTEQIQVFAINFKMTS